MKQIILFIALMASVSCYAQKITTYKASNGVTYNVGDSIKLSRGTGIDGRFLYVTSRWNFSIPDDAMADRRYTNMPVLIKKISIEKFNGIKKVIIIADGDVVNFEIPVEDAIDAGEVIPNKNKPGNLIYSVADEIEKFKKLLDSGAVTQAEYDGQKKRLLSPN
ncbi:SHOCT domain-containing protein [Pedobacter metabolipauper]|uniref:Putative oligomerization/nucleic acid binding protein n=1 Tax=Pedobacter metabolipauper TaxID=425513 RepID=A0A4R6T1B8_9SPHI|nr:SHOCT domain-containing protein [Pedobacter metabolipauper]TDQ11408.1 putative oligomerization/nucleic acid binding protein [Pedobacter metabolipauper]